MTIDYAHARELMVEQQIRPWDVLDIKVLDVLARLPREAFVADAHRALAYADVELPIGHGQKMMKPVIEGRTLQALDLQPGDEVLEIGTGCGYQAAVLARLAREVYTIERLRALHEKARDCLRPLRLANVHLILGDGMLGYAAGAPYAGIISAAGGENLPQQWCDQLAMGGRLVAPLAGGGGRQVLLVVDKTPQGLKQSVLEAVHFVPLKSGIA